MVVPLIVKLEYIKFGQGKYLTEHLHKFYPEYSNGHCIMDPWE